MGKDKQRRVMPFWMPRTKVENNPIREGDWHGYTIQLLSTFYIHSTYYTLQKHFCRRFCISLIIVYMYIPLKPLENVFCNESNSSALGEGKQDQALWCVVVASTTMLLLRQHWSKSPTAYSLKLLGLVPDVWYIGLYRAIKHLECEYISSSCSLPNCQYHGYSTYPPDVPPQK